MKIQAISSNIDIQKYLKALRVESGGVKILEKKSSLIMIELKELHVGAANILKQDALSVGADLAVPKGVIVGEPKSVDALLLATPRELEHLAKKEKAQPFGLKELATYLQAYLRIKQSKPKIMGIINANDDSFYSGSRFRGERAISQIEQLLQDGADIIDIGAVSSRPGAAFVDEDEELERLKSIVDVIYEQRLYEKAPFSIDSYAPKVLEYVLDRGFSIVNDITGFRDDRVCEVTAKYGATAVIMHMQGTPQTMQNNPSYEDVVDEVYSFFCKQIAKVQSYGIKDIVLDVGIGFGKTLQHNLELLRHLKHFQILGYPLLVGVSRKSLIDKITPSDVSRRLGGTLALHLKAIEEGASIIRVHDVYEHYQALKVTQALMGATPLHE